METPPPFSAPTAPKPKQNWTVIILAIVGVFAICCVAPIGALGYFGVKFGKSAMGSIGCLASAQLMGSSLEAFVSEKGRMPDASRWQDELRPYFAKQLSSETNSKETAPFEIWKADGMWSCKDGDQETGFAFNTKASTLKRAEAEALKQPIIFETSAVGINKSSEYKPLPYDQSPKVMGIEGAKRGWIVVNSNGKMGFTKKSGEADYTKSDSMDFGIKVDTDSSSSNE